MPGERGTAGSAPAETGTRVGDDPAIVTNARVREFHGYWLARRACYSQFLPFRKVSPPVRCRAW